MQIQIIIYKLAIAMNTFESSLAKRQQPAQYIEVQHEIDEESSCSKSTIYLFPKDCVTEKIFIPQEWSIDRFQIGKHLGKGKYIDVLLKVWSCLPCKRKEE